MSNEKREKNEKYQAYEGKVLDNRYLIEKLIGIGGMAVVFRAKDMILNDMTVAIKMLKDDVATDEIVVKRFKNESRAETMLKHPNIVGVYDVSVKGEIKYMVMEYVYGITLKKYLTEKKEPLKIDEILSYSMQILKALKQAHENEIIHRDIKPQNIMVLQSGQIKVMDFGIAKLPDAETMTMTEKAIGTVYYMSPEQASGRTIDPRSDLYSLGAMMYELATGKPPFMGDTAISIIMKHINDKPESPRQINQNIPVGLEQIIMCALSKKPGERFQTAEEMLSYVKQLQKDKKIKFDSLPCNTFMENVAGFFGRLFKKKSETK